MVVIEVEALSDNLARFMEHDPLGHAVMPDGSKWFDQLAWTTYLRRVFGDRAELFCFETASNPIANRAASVCEERHFAVIDKRWIADPWLRDVAGMSSNTVRDLHESDRDEILAQYGDPRSWRNLQRLESQIDSETIEVRRCVCPWDGMAPGEPLSL